MTTHTLTYKVVTDHEIRADVHEPAGRGNDAAILYLHGGAMIMGNRQGMPPELPGRCLAAGFTVVSIDYRLAPESKLHEISSAIEDASASTCDSDDVGGGGGSGDSTRVSAAWGSAPQT